MGQAKARGTKEQRVTEGVRIAKENEQKRKDALALAESKLTPEERAKRAKAKLLLLGILAMTPDTLIVNKALKMLS